MKITAFNSSPRGKHGNTNIIVEAFLEGANDAGAETENILLIQKNIKHCMGCFTCWLKTPGKCAIKDDMEGLIQKFMASDIVVLATPLYVDNVSGIMKNFMDRLIPVVDPHFEDDGQGECCHVSRFKKYPKYVAISNCGFPEQSHFQVISHLFKRIARNSKTELIAEIYRGGGELLKNDSLLLKPLIWNYKRLLKKAGEEIVKNLELSDELVKKLEQPLITKEQYIKGSNDYFDKMSKG